jgi:ribonuclease HI
MKPDLTLFADASVNPKTEKSGWGFWIKGDGRNSMHAGGPLRGYDRNTSVAELQAIANGLSCASAAHYICSSDVSIMIQCDNSEALGCLMKARPSITERRHSDGAPVPRRRRRMSEPQEAAVDHILTIADSHNLEISVRHVRGHKEGAGRSWVNRLCDRLAKNGRREAEQVAAA